MSCKEVYFQYLKKKMAWPLYINATAELVIEPPRRQAQVLIGILMLAVLFQFPLLPS